MKIVQISEQLGLTGNDIKFTQKPFFGLQPGAKVLQIGNGKNNGTIRTDVFETPATYVGSVVVKFSKKEEMFAFELDGKVNNKSVYLIYGKTQFEIYTEAVYSKKNNQSYMRFYKPEFKTL